jgi:hypothetical protein
MMRARQQQVRRRRGMPLAVVAAVAAVAVVAAVAAVLWCCCVACCGTSASTSGGGCCAVWGEGGLTGGGQKVCTVGSGCRQLQRGAHTTLHARLQCIRHAARGGCSWACSTTLQATSGSYSWSTSQQVECACMHVCAASCSRPVAARPALQEEGVPRHRPYDQRVQGQAAGPRQADAPCAGRARLAALQRGAAAAVLQSGAAGRQATPAGLQAGGGRLPAKARVPATARAAAVHAPAGIPGGSSGGRSRGLWLRRSAGSSTLWQGRAPSGRLLGGASSQGWCSWWLMCGAAGVQHTECRVLRHSQCAAACWVGGCVLRGTGGCSGAVTVRGMRDCACRVAL